MTYIRIRSYYLDGTFTGCEHLYMTDSFRVASERFLREYPEHKNCSLEISFVHDDIPEEKEYIDVCRRCGVIH